MNLELLFLSSLNACNPKLQEIFNIAVLISHILLLLTCTTKHKEPSNIRNPANVQTAFPSRGLSLSQHGLCLSVMWEACHRLTFQLMLQPSHILDKHFLYSYFLT